MAQCQIGNHGLCASCGEPTNRTTDHIHHWTNRNGGTVTILCKQCVTITLTAASTILRCIEEYNRYSGREETLENLLDTGRVTIAIQELLL